MMMKIGEVFCLIRNGASIKQSDGASGIPITRIETISNRIVDRNKFGYANISNASEYQDYLLQDGDILMSHINSEKHLGKTALYRKYSGEQIIHGMNLLLLRPNAEILLADYAMYILNSEMFLRQLPRITKKSVNQASFNISALKELDVYVPSINRQKEIVSVLDKVDAMLERYKTQFKRLDDLVKSRFVEMFGEPFRCPKWETEQLHVLAESISDGSNVDKQCYKKHDSVLFLRIQNVWFNELRLEDSVYISDAVNKSYYDTSLHKGDLLITKVGRYYTDDSSLGRVSVYLGEDDKANYSNNIMRVRLRNRVNSEFVNALMNLDDYNKYIRNVSVGGTDKRALSKKIIGELPIVVPPKQIQQQYVEFLHQVDKSKLAVKQSLEQLETLKKSLMQQYFGG